MTKTILMSLIMTTALYSVAGTAPKNVISQKSAEALALQQASGEIKSSELEFENKKWIYSFDIQTKTGIQEVQIDAIKGSLVSNKKETVKQESAEAKKEAAEALKK